MASSKQPSTSDWEKEYENVTLDDLQGHVDYLRPFIECIIRWRDDNALSFMEIGVGTGAISMSIKRLIPQAVVAVVDNSTNMLKRFREYYNDDNLDIVTIICDAFEIDQAIDSGKLSIIHHQGLLEHFSLPEINKLLDLHVAMSCYTIFCVPIEGYEGDDVGDELRMAMGAWKAMLHDRFILYECGEFGIDINKNQGYFVISKK